MNESTKYAIKALRNAANKVETGYWYRGRHGMFGPQEYTVTAGGVNEGGNAPKLANGEYPDGGCLVTALMNHFVLAAVRVHLGIPGATDTEIYRLNDSQPLDLGRQWVINAYRQTADKLERGEITLHEDGTAS